MRNATYPPSVCNITFPPLRIMGITFTYLYIGNTEVRLVSRVFRLQPITTIHLRLMGIFVTYIQVHVTILSQGQLPPTATLTATHIFSRESVCYRIDLKQAQFIPPLTQLTHLRYHTLLTTVINQHKTYINL